MEMDEVFRIGVGIGLRDNLVAIATIEDGRFHGFACERERRARFDGSMGGMNCFHFVPLSTLP